MLTRQPNQNNKWRKQTSLVLAAATAVLAAVAACRTSKQFRFTVLCPPAMQAMTHYSNDNQTGIVSRRGNFPQTILCVDIDYNCAQVEIFMLNHAESTCTFVVHSILCVLIFCSRPDRISIIIGLTVWLLSGLINICKHIGWRSIHMIYCIKYIRINLRALLDAIATIRFIENFKAIGQTAIKGFSLPVAYFYKV